MSCRFRLSVVTACLLAGLSLLPAAAHAQGANLHGIGPIQGMVTGMGMPAFMAYGVFAGEVLGPLLLILGFYARVGAALIAVNMLFAFVLVHSGQLASLTQNGGWELELQGMYLFSAVALLLMGPGRIGINQR